MGFVEFKNRFKHWLGPVSLLAVWLFTWGRLWRTVEIAGDIAFLAGVLSLWPDMTEFLLRDGSLAFLVLASIWAAIIFARDSKIRLSWGAIAVALLVTTYLAFGVGQQIPNERLVRDYYAPIAGISPARNGVNININSRGLFRFRNSHLFAPKCRAATPAYDLETDPYSVVGTFTRLTEPFSMFFPIDPETVVYSRLCQVNANIECQLVMADEESALEYNRQVESAKTEISAGAQEAMRTVKILKYQEFSHGFGMNARPWLRCPE